VCYLHGHDNDEEHWNMQIISKIHYRPTVDTSFAPKKSLFRLNTIIGRQVKILQIFTNEREIPPLAFGEASKEIIAGGNNSGRKVGYVCAKKSAVSRLNPPPNLTENVFVNANEWNVIQRWKRLFPHHSGRRATKKKAP